MTIDEKLPLIDPIWPTRKTDALSQMGEFLDSSKFRNESITRLAGAVQIPSESYDDLGKIGEDKRWDTMYDVAAYLEKTFPLVHSKLQLDKINTHGLLFTWKGSDESLKPTVLMAHQDVVPVAKATISQWTHPPYSGAFDGKYIWGRGSSDCKNTLVGILEAVELLVEAGFEPKRTVILSFGFDEESSGKQGAGHLSSVLQERYGNNGVGLIVDEGAGVSPAWGTFFATPAVTEKGYIDVEVTVRMPGGHSSIPPPHNGIGVMSEFITVVENNRHKPYLAPENPFLELLQCGAVHAPDFPSKWKSLLPSKGKENPHKVAKLAEEVAESSDFFKYLFTTSQAVDIIGGGVKANALPERTTALINHRVNIGERVDDVKEHLTKLASQVTKKYNLTLHAFDGESETPSSLTLSNPKGELEPAPLTPTEIDALTPYVVISGTTRALYGEKLNVAPALMTGNTDTRYYWNLTKHVFRYMPGWDPEDDAGLGNIHTVDEKISVTNHINVVKWYNLFLQNIDEAELP
ncbi:carboxypeptidase S [Truncatella angustata]|uniref:Carboxypeptidase S n=1 Tax=Truncatella angustata TaxID=152316 RepID=A0A9P8UYN0_9PEZI|nr:carboxypeptidase S [Truncatella angustata]KAH6660763.1 carboxypeptidase S [Truncatella angustata]